MPCSPDDICIENYFVPKFFCERSLNEAIARLLCFSCSHGKWLGVSFFKLCSFMEEDCLKFRACKVAKQHRLRFELELANYILFCILTLGIYGLFAKKPECPRFDARKMAMPKSGIYCFGPWYIVNALKKLSKQGMIRWEIDDRGRIILFPTRALVWGIFNRQFFFP